MEAPRERKTQAGLFTVFECEKDKGHSTNGALWVGRCNCVPVIHKIYVTAV